MLNKINVFYFYILYSPLALGMQDGISYRTEMYSKAKQNLLPCFLIQGYTARISQGIRREIHFGTDFYWKAAADIKHGISSEIIFPFCQWQQSDETQMCVMVLIWKKC